MFGVPFGPEIDIWSLGCILPELYTGKPLFLGENKVKVLQEVTSILGPIPRSPFHIGKFFEDLSQFIGHNSEGNHLKCVSNVMLKLHNSRNFSFSSFLVGLLKYEPGERLTPYQAVLHPFLASECSFANLLPQQGDKITDAGSCTDISFPTEYNFKPYVDEEVKRQHFSGTELLKRGTTVTSLSPNHSRTKQENVTSLRIGNLLSSQIDKATINEESPRVNQLPLDNSRYAMEGPLATGQPKPTHPQNRMFPLAKGIANTHDTEEERKEVPDRLTSTSQTPTNLSLGINSNAFNKKENCNEKDHSLAGTEVNGPGNEFQRPLVRFENNKSSYSKGKSDVFKNTYVDKGSFRKSYELFSSGNKNVGSTNLLECENRFNGHGKVGFDMDNSSSDGETNAAARTRVYHRKTKFAKVEIECNEVDGLAAVQAGQFVIESPFREAKATVTDVNRRMHLRMEKESKAKPKEDSGKATFSETYQSDEVMLLCEDVQSSF